MAGGNPGYTGQKQAWYNFPRVDNIGSPDPYGGFPKPDSNIQLPSGYPVTALLAGTVTNVDTSSPWGCAVTIKLDNPLNNLATHTAYLHLSNVGVKVGQYVNAGDIIGMNGSQSACGSQKVPLGFALYPGDAYGYGSAWQTLLANVTGKLNPVPILNAAKNGTLSATAYLSQNGQVSTSQQAANCPGSDTAIIGPLVGAWCNFTSQLTSIGEHIAIFVLALVLIIVGLMALFEKQTTQVISKAGAFLAA